jgi:hypothetical protein
VETIDIEMHNKVVLCDIDGVIADPRVFVQRYLTDNNRNWKEYFKHTLVMPVITEMVNLINSLMLADRVVIFHTGRPQSNYNDTLAYLRLCFPNYPELEKRIIMRQAIDSRPTSKIKLDNCARYHPVLVFEDEPEAVMLMHRNGYKVVQVHGYRFDGTPQKDMIPESVK